MKGFTHFISGVAAASCFPGAIEAAAAANPLYFIMGGVGGLLPDTLDFKFVRFLYRVDMHVQPDPLGFDAQLVADAIAYSMLQAQVLERPYRVKLHTVRMAADAWQQYRVEFDSIAKRIRVEEGPVVTTGQSPVQSPEFSNRGRDLSTGEAGLACEVRLDYESVVKVDIFDGPIFDMVPEKGGRVVCPHFIPWHRRWTHSLVVAAGLGVGISCVWGWLAGAIFACAYSVHVLEDQLGYMGASLWWPISARRCHGMGRMHALDVFPNVMTVWGSLLLVFWNLYWAVPEPMVELNLVQVVVVGIGLPVGAHAWWVRQAVG